MKKRTIAGRQVGAIGLGCMGMSWAYGAGDREGGLATLARALEIGVDHWDTADLYGAGENETLLSEALKGHRDEVFLATKFGNVYDRTLTTHQDQVQANAGWIVDGTPQYVRKAIDLSLQRLKVDHVDLYYQHRVDPQVPIEETVGAMAELVREGKVKALGLSEASAETIRRAHATFPIAAVQSELSLWTQDYLDDVVPLTKELGIAFVPYSPLGRGFLTGALKNLDDLAPDDWRRNNPRFQGEQLQANLRIVNAVERVASRLNAKPSQVALAWVLAQGDHLCPIPGTKRVEYLEENAAAADLILTPQDIEELNAIPAPIGTRYPEAMMANVNR
jgi:aryl-alcohol dehydrogenase-like predicted oxidoreductase